MSFMGSACAFGLTDGRHFGYFRHILLENHDLSYGPDIVERPSELRARCVQDACKMRNPHKRVAVRGSRRRGLRWNLGVSLESLDRWNVVAVRGSGLLEKPEETTYCARRLADRKHTLGTC